MSLKVMTKDKLRIFLEKQKKLILDAEMSQLDIVKSSLNLFLYPLSDPIQLKHYDIDWNMLKEDSKKMFYHYIALFVLEHVLVHWSPCFSLLERTDLLQVVFLSEKVSASSLFCLLCQVIKEKQHQVDPFPNQLEINSIVMKSCMEILDEFLGNHGIRRILREQKIQANNTMEQTQIITNIVSLPDYVASRLKSDFPSFMSPMHYFPIVIESTLVTCLEQVENKTVVSEEQQLEQEQKQQLEQEQTTNQQTNQFGLCLLEKVVRLGHAEMFSDLWQRLLELQLYSLNQHRIIFESLGISIIEKLVYYLVCKLSSQEIHVLFQIRLNHSLLFQDVLYHRLLLKRNMEEKDMKKLVDLLITSKKSLLLLSSFLSKSVKLWSEKYYVDNGPLTNHCSLTCFIQLALQNMTKEQLLMDGQLLSTLTKGVEVHLGNPLETKRQMGMQVAVQLSKLLDPNDPLEFEALSTCTSIPPSVKNNNNNNLSIEATRNRIQQKNRLKNKSFLFDQAIEEEEIDPDEEVGSSSSDCTDMGFLQDELDHLEETSEEDSDDSLEPYDLHDDEEDLKKVPSPVYLTSCLKNLRGTSDEMTAALSVLPQLIRSHPYDLDLIAKDLAIALLHLSDTVSEKDLKKRMEALIALCRCSPERIAKYFTQVVFQEDFLLQTRLDILLVMEAAAYEFANLIKDDQTDTTPSISISRLSTPPSGSLLLSTPPSGSLRLPPKTRRWSKQRQNHVVNNEFAKHAGFFFYSLLHAYGNPVRPPDAFGKEGLILSQLITTLGSLVECARNAPITIPMAKTLIQFVWQVRSHESSQVRECVLYAIAKIVLVVPLFLLKQEILADPNSFLLWLQQIQFQDPHDNCRKGAQMLLDTQVFSV